MWPRVGRATPSPPGETVTRELAPGESHVFRFEIEAGQLLEALVEQQGADVAITLVEPDGTAALQVDEHHDPRQVERVLWVARASGTHSLRIHASPDRPRGRYRVTLDPPRPASPGDVARVAAQKDYVEAVRLGAEGRDRTAPQERRLLEGALEVFRAAGDRRGEAGALEAIAEMEFYANRMPQSVASAEGALALYRALQDRAGEAAAMAQAAWAMCATGDTQRGLERFQEAIRLAHDIPDEWLEATGLNHMGTVVRRSGDGERAIEWYRQAIAKSRIAGNRRTEAAALNNLGIAYKEIGDLDEALAGYEQALIRFRALEDAPAEARTLNNMGNVYKLMGDNVRARDLYLRYLAMARERDPAGDDEARALNNLAGVASLIGDHAEGLEYSRRSLEIRTTLGDVPGQASAMHNAAENLHKLGRNHEAVTSLREALRIRRSLGERYSESDTLVSLAEVERDRGNLREALAHAEATVALTEELRSALTNPDLRASYVAAAQDRYGLYIDLLMRLHEQEAGGGHDTAALQASERARARVLLDALIEARADIRNGVEPSLLERERALQKRFDAASGRLARVLARKGTAEDVARARGELEAAAKEYRETEARIRQESPRYAALTQPVPATVDEIRREILDEDTVLLEFYLGEERSFLWAVTRSELVSKAVPRRAQIEAAARSVHALLTAGQRTRDPASVHEADRRLQTESMALSRLLLGPLASRLAGDWKGKRLLVVPSGALAYLPLGALPSPGEGAARPLLRDHEIVFAPSASVLIAIRREPAAAEPGATSVAVLADPVFDASDPRVHPGAASARASRPPPTGLTRAMSSLGSDGFARLPFSRGEANAMPPSFRARRSSRPPTSPRTGPSSRKAPLAGEP